jgi:hypothetical protein
MKDEPAIVGEHFPREPATPPEPEPEPAAGGE